MISLDSISLDPSGFLDMDSFTDGSDLPEGDLAGLRGSLLSDPIDEPSDDEWALLWDEVLDEADVPVDGGPFVVDDDGASFAGVRDVGGDDPLGDDPDDGDGPVIEDTTGGDRGVDPDTDEGSGGLVEVGTSVESDDDGSGLSGLVDLDDGLDPTGSVGVNPFQDLDIDDGIGLASDGDADPTDDGGGFGLGSIF